MNYSIAKYTLPSSGRKGFLLRLEDKDSSRGYSDCFSWPELGDFSLDQHIELIRSGDFDHSPVLNISLKNALLDLEARANGKSLLSKFEAPIRNHLFLGTLNEDSLVLWENRKLGACVKIKLGLETSVDSCLQFVRWFSKLESPPMVRLDINGHWKLEYLEFLSEMSSQIDFVEDPFSSIGQEWIKLESQLPEIQFAADFASLESEDLDMKNRIQIVKPARDLSVQAKVNSARRSIFTSYLGHPVGRAHDMRSMLENGSREEVHGLSLGDLSKMTDWFPSHGGNPIFESAPSLGIGFDSQLRGLEWISVR